MDRKIGKINKLFNCNIESTFFLHRIDVNNGSVSSMPASCCRPQFIERESQNCLNAAPLFFDRYYDVI